MSNENNNLDPIELDPINLPLNPVSVYEFYETMGELRLNGYERANEVYTWELDRILARTSTYDELKRELTYFLKGRKEFGDFVASKFDDEKLDYNL